MSEDSNITKIESYFINTEDSIQILLYNHNNSGVLSHKLEMELLQSAQHLLDHLLLGEDGGPEVVGAGHLTEARARDDADAGGLQQLEGGAAEQVVKKTKTIQHLLSDWRTAYAMNKKVILLDFSFYLTFLI